MSKDESLGSIKSVLGSEALPAGPQGNSGPSLAKDDVPQAPCMRLPQEKRVDPSPKNTRYIFLGGRGDKDMQKEGRATGGSVVSGDATLAVRCVPHGYAWESHMYGRDVVHTSGTMGSGCNPALQTDRVPPLPSHQQYWGIWQMSA